MWGRRDRGDTGLAPDVASMSDCPFRTIPPSGRMAALPRGHHHYATHFGAAAMLPRGGGKHSPPVIVSYPPQHPSCAGAVVRCSASRHRPSEAVDAERSSLSGEGGQGSVVVEERRTRRFSEGDVAYPTDRILGGERLDVVPICQVGGS
jgi:hypothetical protein